MKIVNNLISLWEKTISCGVKEGDSSDLVLQKQMLTLLPIIIGVAAAIWGSIYLWLERPISASIPLFYSIISFFSLLYFSSSKNIKFIYISQLILVLVLPFLLMWSLGGMKNGSFVMIWAFYAPIAALSFSPKNSTVWISLFFILTIVSFIINGTLEEYITPMSSQAIDLFSLLNAGAGFGGIFYLMWHYVTERNHMITKHIENEKKLYVAKESAEKAIERFNEAVLATEDGIWDWNIVTNEVYYSPTWQTMLGYEIGKIEQVVDSWKKLLHPDDLDRALEHATKFINNEISEYRIEFRMLCKDGSYKWVLARAKDAERDENGIVTRIVGTHVDIQKNKDYEEELKTIFEMSRDGIAVLDLESNFVKVNKAYSNMTGYSESELLTKSCISMSIPEDIPKAQKVMGVVLETGYVENFEKGCYRKDGTVVNTNMSIALMPDKQNLLINTKDITESVNVRQKLIEAKQMAEDATRSKSEFLANMSHEIRTPMNSIIGMTQLALDGKLDDKEKNYVQKANVAAKNLLGIINDILDFSKIEAGKLELSSNHFALKDVIGHTLHLISVAAKNKDLSTKVKIDSNTPKYFFADALRIGQVLTNLASNAVKFSKKSGNITLDISLLKEDEKTAIVRFSVIDEGIGISEENQKKLFKSFSQADSSTQKQYGGTGLGLCISKKIVDLMDGEIWLESKVYTRIHLATRAHKHLAS